MRLGFRFSRCFTCLLRETWYPSSQINPEDGDMIEPKMGMEVPAQVREFAEKSVDQAEKAFDAFIDAANKSASMIPNPTTETSKKALSFTETNMKAALDRKST